MKKTGLTLELKTTETNLDKISVKIESIIDKEIKENEWSDYSKKQKLIPMEGIFITLKFW